MEHDCKEKFRIDFSFKGTFAKCKGIHIETFPGKGWSEYQHHNEVIGFRFHIKKDQVKSDVMSLMCLSVETTERWNSDMKI